MTLATIRMWTQQRPWAAAAIYLAFVLAATDVAAAVHHVREGFVFAVFAVNVVNIAVRFADDPGVDRTSLFMRRR